MRSNNAAHPWAVSHEDEPHLRRRLRILGERPEIRTLFGYDVRTAWVTVAVVVAQVGMAWGINRFIEGRSTGLQVGVLLAAGFGVGAILCHWLAMSIHEATHNLALPTRGQNIALGLFANIPMVVPVAATFMRYHIEHHARLGILDEDTDLPSRWEVRFIGNSTWRKAMWWVFYAPVYMVRGLTFIGAPDRTEWLNFAVMVVANAALFPVVGGWGMAYLGVSLILAHGFHPVAAHFIHEHYIFSPGQETYSYYGSLNWVTFNVGYHVEHHDFMNVPGWALPKLKRLAGGEYEQLVSHRSWTGVLWKFITEPTLGFQSRLVRTRADFSAARQRLAKQRRRPQDAPTMRPGVHA